MAILFRSVLHSLVSGPVLGGSTGVALPSVGGRGVAGESLLAEHGVAVVEEEDGVTGALDRGDLGCLGALAGGAVREPTCEIKWDLEFGKNASSCIQRVNVFDPFSLSAGT